MIDDQALYLSKLLLHTAISSKKTKDLDNARLFYDTVIKLYPDSNESKIAKKYLSILSNN